MTVFGLDIGTSHVGIARADPSGRLATPVDTLSARPVEALLAQLAGWLQREGAVGLVVGIPFQVDGSAGAAVRRTRRFVERLQALLPELPVHEMDERLSTRQAQRQYEAVHGGRRADKATVDRMAATLVLQAWLDARR
jgi:putative Holliday junction resolvase